MKVLALGFLALFTFAGSALAADSSPQCIYFNGKQICDDGSAPSTDTSDTVAATPTPAMTVASGPTPGDVRTRCRSYSNGSDCRTERYTCWYPRSGELRCRWLGPEAAGYGEYYAPVRPFLGLVFFSGHGHHHRHHH